jgi:hypothetical protein
MDQTQVLQLRNVFSAGCIVDILVEIKHVGQNLIYWEIQNNVNRKSVNHAVIHVAHVPLIYYCALNDSS